MRLILLGIALMMAGCRLGPDNSVALDYCLQKARLEKIEFVTPVEKRDYLQVCMRSADLRPTVATDCLARGNPAECTRQR